MTRRRNMQQASLSSNSRQAIWEALKANQDQPWDLIIVGGGITGAGILREAVRQGRKVLLVEQHDFAWGTSSRSSKMVHGGLRYLALGDFKLTRDAVRERQRLLQEAPGLVEPLHFLMPHYARQFPGPRLFQVVLGLYDHLAGQKKRHLYSAAEAALLVPGLKQDRLLALSHFTDAVTDDARLVLRVLQEARAQGGVALNYVSAREVLRDQGRVGGVRLCDQLSGETLEIRARAVINATGAWSDQLRAKVGDKACEILGSGGNGPHIACMSYGTTATINTTHRRYIEAIPLMPPYPSAIPGAYCAEVMIYRGFWMVSWFKKEFGLREQRIARERGIEPEVLFDELVSQVPPGSMGLTLQPYWSPGVRDPGPEAKGAIIGFGDVHTRAHIYRAILEGLAYGLREGRERIERRSGVKIEKLRVSGGGSQSDLALQLTADIFNLPVERPHTYETSGLGAAIDAMVGLGVHPDFETAIARMTRVGQTFQPNPEAVRIYDRLYREVYTRMYKQLRPLYQSIRAITGYPR